MCCAFAFNFLKIYDSNFKKNVQILPKFDDSAICRCIFADNEKYCKLDKNDMLYRIIINKL